MQGFRTGVVTAAALVLLAQPGLAADAAGSGARQVQPPPLKPGKSAGVRHAQAVRGGLALVGAGGVIALVALGVSTGGGGGGNANQPNMQTVPVTTAP